MHTLTKNVIYATGLRREIARQAITQTVLFLRDEEPWRCAADLADMMRALAEAQNAAAAGVAAPALRLRDAPGCDKLRALAESLASLGLNEAQVVSVVKEVLAHAEQALGAMSVAERRRILDELAQAFERISFGMG